MSNICSGCGGLIEYSLVPRRNVRSNHCHFCIREFSGRADKLGKRHEEKPEAFKGLLDTLPQDTKMSHFNHKRYARVVAKVVLHSIETCAFSDNLTYEEMVLVEDYLIEIAERITKEDVTSMKSQKYRANPHEKGTDRG